MIKWIFFVIVNLPLVIYMPWILRAWRYSPLDKDGPVWVIAAIVALVLNLPFIVKEKKSIDKSALVLIVFSCLFLGIGVYLNVRIFSVIAALMLSLSMLWFLWGWNIFLILLPAYFILVFSLPTTSYIIWYLISKNQIMSSMNAISVKTAVSFIFFLSGWIYSKQKTYYLTRLNGIYWCSIILFLLILIFSYIPSSQSGAFNISLSVEPKNGWYGQRASMTGIENQLYSKANTDKYDFYNEEGYCISIIKFKVTEDNIHSIHPADYCLRGAGWTILSDSRVAIEVKGSKYLIRKISASFGSVKMIFYSWYSSDKMSTNDFKVFRIKRKTDPSGNWQGYLVSINEPESPEKSEKILSNFIESRMY